MLCLVRKNKSQNSESRNLKSVPICAQVVKTRKNTEFLESADGQCQHGGGLKHNSLYPTRTPLKLGHNTLLRLARMSNHTALLINTRLQPGVGSPPTSEPF